MRGWRRVAGVMMMGLAAALGAAPAAAIETSRPVPTESETARLQLQDLATQLDLYRLYVGRYPTEQEGLVALMQRRAAGGVVASAVAGGTDKLTDPWGQPYRYRYPGRYSEYDLYSLGADNAEGGDGENSDITNW